LTKIYTKLFGFLEIGDDFPTIIMSVINLSPESFYQGSVYHNSKTLKKATMSMIKNGAKILDIGARSTAPWSKKISVQEEINRIIPAMENVCDIISDNIIISVDTQYREVAKKAYEISQTYKKKILINDVSCLKTDPSLIEFVCEENIPIILMASKEIPGDLLTIGEIIKELEKTITLLKDKGYDEKNIILDPGIGKWIQNKEPKYDIAIIDNLEELRELNRPILIAISRKSFIGSILEIPEPEKRLNGTLATTAIAVYNGAHIVRTHDVTPQLTEIIKMAKAIRGSKR